MRLKIKKLNIDLLDTVIEAICNWSNIKNDLAEQVLSECNDALYLVASQFDNNDIIESEIKRRIIQISDSIILLVNRNNIDFSLTYANSLLEEIESIKSDINSKIISKLEILFLPYKYSMWDCMASIWEAAKEDPMCNCHIVPIPFYDKNADRSLGALHYEGLAFTTEIEDYKSYQLEIEQPDIVYFHNPYDEFNTLTNIEPRFYVKEIKKYTDMLVYVPYFLLGSACNYKDISWDCKNSGSLLADKIVIQSKVLKECCLMNGLDADSLMVLGNPKIDAVVNMKEQYEIPKEWNNKLSGRKIILLNSSITTFLLEKEWLQNIKEIVMMLNNKEGIGLVWRPHPLLEVTIKTMRSYDMELYGQILQIVETSNNIVRDSNDDLYLAIGISDGLISDKGTILYQYAFTGKPSLSLVGSGKMRDQIVFCDYFANYFLEDGTSVEEFIDIIMYEKDNKKEERLLSARKSVVNPDGTSGSKIHEAIKVAVLEK